MKCVVCAVYADSVMSTDFMNVLMRCHLLVAYVDFLTLVTGQ